MFRFFLSLVFSICVTYVAAQNIDEGKDPLSSEDNTKTTLSAVNYELGRRHEAEEDFVGASQFYKLAAKGGNAEAQNKLGWMYVNGIGVLEDFAEGMRWYRLAGENGHINAQLRLGFIYEYGTAVLQDYREAERWYRLAAEQGHSDAQKLFGDKFAKGGVVKEDAVIAHMWYNVASANGSTEAALKRDSLAEEMTRDQIVDAQARARVCMESNYRDCG